MASTGLNSSVQPSDTEASHADIAVALTSHNDVRTIGGVARAIRDVVARHFATRTMKFILADAGSTDGTREAVLEAVGPSALIEPDYQRGSALGEPPFHGQPSRTAALRAILQTAQRLDVKACAVLDASMPAADLEAIERLIAPVLDGRCDYVSPHYARGIFQGAITKGIVYPVFRAMYGARLRQPAGIDFGCSGALLSHFLDLELWELDQATVGIDLWLAAEAVCGGFRVCEALLGPRSTVSRDVRADLSTTLAQIVGALFADVERRVDAWQRIRGSVPTPVVGTVAGDPPAGPPAHPDTLIESYRLGYRELRDIWRFVLPPRTIVELRKLAEAGVDRFALDDRLWATIVYDFALGYSLRVMGRDHLLRSLTPLYNGWMASFALQTTNDTVEQADERVERLCLAFEAEKRYVISRWRWPERLR